MKFQKTATERPHPTSPFSPHFFVNCPGQKESVPLFVCFCTLHSLLPFLSSLFFIWQEERKGRREHRGDFIIEKKEVRKSGEEGAASALQH